MKDNVVKAVLGCFCVAIVATFCVVLALESQYGNDIKNKANEIADSATNTASDVVSAVTPQGLADAMASSSAVHQKSYIIKAYDQKIGVFIEGENTPIKTVDTDTRSLPEYDKELLNQGIRVNSETDLKYFLQDFEN